MTTSTQARYNFRAYRDGDFDEVRRLWRDDAKWGDLTPQMWRDWYVDIPSGPALIVVGEDAEGSIIAQAAMTPYRLWVGEEERLAVHVSAPIISRKLQTLAPPTPKHPVVGLLVACNKLAEERGIAALFAMPRQAWIQLVRLAPLVGLPRYRSTTMPCAQVRLTDPPPPQPQRLVTRAISHFDEAYDELWQAARRNLDIQCSVIRDRTYLNYRNGGRLCLEMRDAADGTLVGYTAVREDGQLMDMLPRDRSWTRDLLAATWRHLFCDASLDQTAKMRTFRVMRTPLIDDAVRDLAFANNRFNFAFTCRAIDETLSRQLAFKHWYLTPNG